MFKKKPLTLSELDKLEEEKLKNKNSIREKLAAWLAKRPEILSRIADYEADGNQVEARAARAELKTGDDQIKAWEVEIEIIDASLQKLPKQRSQAQGVALDALIPNIKKLDANLDPLIANTLQKADAFARANDELLDALSVLDDVPQMRGLSLGLGLVSYGVNVLRENTTLPAGGETTNRDLALLLMGSTYKKEVLQVYLDEARREISKRIGLLQDHANRLRGVEVLEHPEWPYCPNCYSLLSGTQKQSCMRCGKNVEPVY